MLTGEEDCVGLLFKVRFGDVACYGALQMSRYVVAQHLILNRARRRDL